MTTLPALTQEIDDTFTHTWYEIRADAVDNILNATPVTALLRMKGCFKPQVGGEFITRTIRYNLPSTQAITKGSILNMGETQHKTMSRHTWRYTSVHMQRSLMDDQKNAGKSKIADLVATEIEGARDALKQQVETDLMRAETTDETGDHPQSLYDFMPDESNKQTGTYGAITRPTDYDTTATSATYGKPNAGNTWWGPCYRAWTAPREVHLVTDMNSLYNTIGANQEPPDVIITDQATHEIYEAFAVHMSQLVKDSGSQMADLGFDVLRYKGKPLIWTPSVQTAQDLLMLNTAYVDVVYDPNLWFDMTEWKVIPRQTERIAHIISTMTVVCSQLRRQGMMTNGALS